MQGRKVVEKKGTLKGTKLRRKLGWKEGGQKEDQLFQAHFTR